MKKEILLGAAICALAFAACSRDAETEYMNAQAETATARFGLQLQGQPITRASGLLHSDILNAINYLAPTEADVSNTEFTLTDLTDGSAAIKKLGTSYTLYAGDYAASLQYIRNGFNYDKYRLMYYASFEVCDTLSISASQTDYTLQAEYNCFALTYDRSCATLTIDGQAFTNSALESAGILADVCFIYPTAEDWQIELTIAPAEGQEGRTRTFTISAADVEYGYYYFVEPSSTQLAKFALAVPEFKRGEL